MSGSPEWAALYQKHKDAMYKVAARVLREAGLADQAEDAVADAITSMIQSPPLAEVKNWEAFMVTAAKRKALDRLKSAAVQHSGPELSELSELPSGGDFADEVAEEIDRQRLGARLWDARAVLDVRERRILEEHIERGRSQAEVATEFGISRSRVSQIVTTALKKLRAKLTEEAGEDE
ncbi:sigma-70 family RNA polymerase sigma factor [Kribbella sp. NPDC026611]|uniref:sigma-70 family RNA polymerase sigma factor n=1 Tax=Kribbella sp. NPDC026611 TaxID=3154911 RepID=UPI0033D1FE44